MVITELEDHGDHALLGIIQVQHLGKEDWSEFKNGCAQSGSGLV